MQALIQNVSKYRSKDFDRWCRDLTSDRLITYIHEKNVIQSHLCALNYFLQQCALNKSARENTNTDSFSMTDVSDEDFKDICHAAETLQLVSDKEHEKQPEYVAIIIPGALQTGFQKRFKLVQDYLKHAKFNGQLFIFGTMDRRLYAFNNNGVERESATFELLQERLKLQSVDEVKTLCRKQLDNLLAHNDKKSLSEIQIAHHMADYFEKTYNIVWPNEFDMAQKLLERTSFGNCKIQCIATTKQQSQHERATTEDEAQFVAEALTNVFKNQENVAVAVASSFSYQLLTYQTKLPNNIHLDMLSPYKNITQYIEQSVKTRPQIQNQLNNTQAIRQLTCTEIFDAFARYIYAYRALTPVTHEGCARILQLKKKEFNVKQR